MKKKIFYLVLLMISIQNNIYSKEIFLLDFLNGNRCLNKGDFINELVDQNVIFVGPGLRNKFKQNKIDISLSTKKDNGEANFLLRLYEVPYRQPEGEPIKGKPILRVSEKIKITPGDSYQKSFFLNIPDNYSQFKVYYDSFTVYFDLKIEQSEREKVCFDEFKIKGIGIK
ncbi:hypothetical protein ND860_18595 [Leptospira levettii]|uniref:hypothetical protein n=1 Tax=Leptospira levettii TaxID=2023178 RepID=UPI00223E037F|nr:hypothetical protein [Leptospira levettii]MCW7498551.1 hypothetical protein [Leptospira levettii]